MKLSRVVKLMVLGASLVLAQVPLQAAKAEIDLGDWNTYATMAEQGAVCGAFADIMAMQSLVDEKLGRLWTERRNYSGSVIRRAAGLEGRPDINDEDIDSLLNRYSMWLLNNLANPVNAEILNPDARDTARDMVADVCTTLYTQADKAIIQKHPTLSSCSAATAGDLSIEAGSREAGASPQQCNANEALLAAATVKKVEKDLAGAVLRLSEEEDRRRQAQQRSAALEGELATLQAKLDALRDGADAARDTAMRAVELNRDNDQMKGEITTLKETIDGFNAISDENAAINAQNDVLASRIQTLEANIKTLTEELGTAEQRISELPTKAELASAQNDTAAAKRELALLASQLASARSERDDAIAAFDAVLTPDAMPEDAAIMEDSVAAIASEDSASPISTPEQATELELLDSEAANELATSQIAASEIEAVSIELVEETMFVAQLGAFRSRTGAASEIVTLEQAFPDQLATAGLNVAADERSNGQNLFRIMTSSMTVEDAKQLCSRLWDQMVGCMVKAVP